jgi:hypothetical protein
MTIHATTAYEMLRMAGVPLGKIGNCEQTESYDE